MPTQYIRGSIEIRFWAKVDKTPGYGPWGNCWRWIAGHHPKGYGTFAAPQWKEQRAHRVAYILAHGPIPKGKQVLHHCDIRDCVRDEHFFLGINADNVRDRHQKGRSASGDRSGARQHPERITRGEKHGRPKLTETKVREIRLRYARALTTDSIGDAHGGKRPRNLSYQTLAREYGISDCTVGAIIRRKKWKHVE